MEARRRARLLVQSEKETLVVTAGVGKVKEETQTDFRNVVEAGLRRRLMDCMCVCLGERSRE